MSVDPEPHMDDPSLIEDPRSILLSLGLIAISDPDSGKDSCNCRGGGGHSPG